MQLLQPGRRIFVGTSLDRASAIALQRAYSLASTFTSSIRVVHALPWREAPLVRRYRDVMEEIALWAVTEAKVVLDPSDVVLSIEAPATALAEEARKVGASLILLGASRPRLTPGVAERTMQLVHCPVLIAQPPRRREEVVAATDLRDRRFPVVHAAASLADACAARLTLVHNVEDFVRETRPNAMAPAMRDLVGLSRKLPAVKRAHLATLPSTAEAIATIANDRAADLVAVGVRPGRGRVVGELLAATSSSVLAIPLRDVG